MKTLVHLIVGLVILASCSKKENEIVYPQPKPSGAFLKFLPGIVSSDSTFEFNSLFDPAGKTFYFSRNEIHDIYQTTFNGSQWTSPIITSFSEKEFKECDPAFSPDGNKLYYISTRKRNPTDSINDFDIWFVERVGEKWSDPQNLEIVNSDSSEFYVSFAKNGNLYFASNREGSIGSFDIYVSRFVKGAYTIPENVGNAVNDEHMEHDPFISSDERLLIFTSVNREDGIGRGDLYYSVRNAEGNWLKARNLGPTINSADYDFCPYISPDGNYFFYSDNNDVKWINIEQLNKIVFK
jgi:Tol biopolymer transport system component